MPDWWEQPYPTGPKVAVPGFPRPLYPPDAAEQGKQPSTSGPDVEAYKRTIWRAGRWQGPASNFDRAYSNGFAHGRSGNVIDTGMAGVQRQQGIDDSGWVGKPTFDALRSILIPKGLANAGKPAMDATAANLIAQAWEMFGGSEPDPTPPSTPSSIRQKALAGAISYLGVKESPSGSNHTPFGTWYGVDQQPWCAIFVTYCFEVEAGGSKSFTKGKDYAYVPYVVSDARNGRNGLRVVTSPIPGDLVCFDWAYDGTFDHIGIFEGWDDGTYFKAIEGNTSADAGGDQSNGGEVCRKKRSTARQSTVFVRVDE